MGMGFANVFQGTIGPDGTTLTGTWVDVPRGGTNSSGTLGLQIVEVPVPPVPTFPPSAQTMLELRQIPAETTGGFGGTLWTKTASSLGPQDIVSIRGDERELAVRWRAAFRDVVGGALQDGYAAVGMTRSGWYILRATGD